MITDPTRSGKLQASIIFLVISFLSLFSFVAVGQTGSAAVTDPVCEINQSGAAGTWVGMAGTRVGMAGTRVGMAGIQVGMSGNWVGMAVTRDGMAGT